MNSDEARRKRSPRAGAALLAATALAVALLANGTQGAGRPGSRAPVPLPNFSATGAARTATLAASTWGKPTPKVFSRAGSGQATAIPGVKVQLEAFAGLANRVSRSFGALTKPTTEGTGTVVRKFLAANPTLYGLSPSEINTLTVARRLPISPAGGEVITLGQQFQGIPVFQSELKVVVSPRGELISTSGTLTPRLPKVANAATPRLSAAEALALAAGTVGRRLTNPPTAIGPASGARQRVPFAPGSSFARPPVLELAYYPLSPTRVALAWETTLYLAASGDANHLLIDATTGQLLFRTNYRAHASGSVYTTEAPVAEFPWTSPYNQNRTVRNFHGGESFNGAPLFPAGNPHFDWWAGAPQTKTLSNNALAQPQRNGVIPGTPSPVPGPGGNFTYPLNLNQPPSAYTNAATVNLFYWLNRLHDIWYQYGFTEANGNFQFSNLGLPAPANSDQDGIEAYAQFGADLNNPSFQNGADITVPPDGEAPVLRLYEYTTTNPDRDSALSAALIAHEYGHGLTRRLVGVNSFSEFQSQGLDEGLSDFQALIVNVQPGDDINGIYPFGGYLANNLPQGMRSQSYCTNVNGPVFTRTYGKIAEPPDAGPHKAGEVLANAWWQTFGKIQSRLGFAPGRARIMRLLTLTLQMLPDNPTFLDCRDALLHADAFWFGGEDQRDILQAFASRGMGSDSWTAGPEDTLPHEDFGAAFMISGRVTNADGSPGAGVGIRIQTSDEAVPPINETSTDSNGTYVLFAPVGTFYITAGSRYSPFDKYITVGPDQVVNFTESLYEIQGADTILAAENGPPVNVTVVRQGNLSSEGKVRVNAVRGENFAQGLTLGGGEPFGNVPSIVLTFAPGEASKTFTVKAIQDDVLEQTPEEGFAVRLRPYGGTLGPNDRRPVAIEDDRVNTAPNNLVVTEVTPTTVALEWNNRASNRTGFRIEITGPAGVVTQDIGGTATTRKVQGLDTNRTYKFRVAALRSTISAVTAYSNSVEAFTLATTYAFQTTAVNVLEKGAPVNVTITRSGNTAISGSVRIVGAPTGANPADAPADYTLTGNPSGQVSFAPGETTKTVWLSPVADNLLEGHQRANLALTQAVNGAIGSPGITPLLIYDDTATPTPDQLIVTGVTISSVSLSWRDRCGNTEGFQLERSGPGGTLFRSLPASPTTYTDTGLTANATYRYRLRAFRSNLFSNASSIVEAVPSGGEFNFVGTPANTPEGNSVTIFIARTGNTTGTGFVQCLSTTYQATPGSDFTSTGSTTLQFAPGETLKSLTVNTLPDNLLEGNEQARFRLVQPTNGLVGTNQELFLTILDDIASIAPAQLQVTGVTSTTVSLAWQNRSGNASSNRLERSGPGGTVLISLLASSTSYTDSGLTPGVTYRYRVRVIRNSLSSNASNEVTATPN